MGNLDGWDFALLIIVGYVAVLTLVRLMVRHRDLFVERFRRDVERQKKSVKAQAEAQKHAAAGRRQAG